MNVELIEALKTSIVERFGPWSAHNIHLMGDSYTIRKGVVGDEVRLRRVIQCVSDLSQKAFTSLRVLDLACLEGLYAVELARRGARVVGIEGRDVNVAKAQFAKEVLALENLEVVQDDVRNLSKERYGSFDVVVCAGILYHLDSPDLFSFLESIADVCLGFLLLDTHISTVSERSVVFKEHTYWGTTYREHDLDSSPAERAKSLWASLDNPQSFWLTRQSLYNLLMNVGFTSVFECHMPPERTVLSDRVTLIAFRGQRQHLVSSPILNDQPIENVSELVDPLEANQLRRVSGGLESVTKRSMAPLGRLLGRFLR